MRTAAALLIAVGVIASAPLARAQAPAPPVPVRGADALPATIPLFPLDNLAVLPNRPRLLHIFEPRYRAMMADALKGDRVIGMVQLKPGYEADYEGRPPIFAIGCAGAITQFELLEDGRYNLVLTGLVRFRVLSEDQSRPYRLARVEPLPEVEPDARMLAAIAVQRQKLLALIEPRIAEQVRDLAADDLINSLAMGLMMSGVERQTLIERNDVESRGAALIELLTKR
jgi:Lon protease-like protein